MQTSSHQGALFYCQLGKEKLSFSACSLEPPLHPFGCPPDAREDGSPCTRSLKETAVEMPGVFFQVSPVLNSHSALLSLPVTSCTPRRSSRAEGLSNGSVDPPKWTALLPGHSCPSKDKEGSRSSFDPCLACKLANGQINLQVVATQWISLPGGDLLIHWILLSELGQSEAAQPETVLDFCPSL